MRARPRVFIGSSSEAEDVTVALQSALGDAVDSYPWLDAFNLSEYTHENLVDEAKSSEFAIFVFAPDDFVESRGERMAAPRDNVVFELGFFSAILGRRRVFVVKAEGESVKVPSDLAGVSFATYRAPEPGPNKNKRWVTALRPAAKEIEDAIDRELSRPAHVALGGPHGGMDRPSSLLAEAAVVDARRGHLQRLADVAVGLTVVHALHGIGQVVGFDPADPNDVRIVRVRFPGGLAAVPQSELFDPDHRRS